MKTYSLNGVKSRARNEWLQLGPQRVHGATVVSDNVAVTALYDTAADAFTWIVAGRFASENEAGECLLDMKPSTTELTTQQSFARFDAWRIDQVQALDLGNPEYAALARLSESWQQLYAGSEGYQRIQRMLPEKAHDQGWMNLLRQKEGIAEKGLVDIANRFTTEFKRLELVPVVA